ncbi:uncharacterized protein LOC127718122 [Mytilus californianus]|uniref:uncharacterized protein LOC127718122 n=1 Tax=Mytilus californianus TaxID=6549 RepID=UPI0022453736|nr:uncharacterized protein LOC127718122 [Mytilus californianus]
MRKISYLELYGVKRFPYRGRRAYTPLLHQSIDGGMIISNDVFGLTIRQFERIYKACLDRRKTQEQRILNIRYPVKTSNYYMEYLQNCIDYNRDDFLGNDPREKNLYELLVKTVGTEIYIRERQRLFILEDLIFNASSPIITQILSGSLSEGLDLPSSDIDIMYVSNNVDVIRNVKNAKNVKNTKHLIQSTTLVMETDNENPGFTRLRLIAGGESVPCLTFDCFKSTRDGLYLSVNAFVSNILQLSSHAKLIQHGPCLSDKDQITDLAYCLRSKYLPYNAVRWATRHRQQWPPNFVIEKALNYGCLLVPIGPKTVSDSDLLWRLSFSVTEKLLVHSFNFTQLLCYGLLKLTLKRIVNTIDVVNELLCSYFLKTALFWVSEEEDIDTFQLSKLFRCFFLCLDKVMSWVNNCYCQNYFIPEHNMFLGKINQSNKSKLLNVLDSIKCGGIDGLKSNLFPPDNVNTALLSTKWETSFFMLDLLIYKICESITIHNDISICYKELTLTNRLLKSESSVFIIDVCKYHYARISQFAAQKLLPLNTTNKTYKIHNIYHRHLLDGINADAVSGWLLYASFYYVTGQYTVSLRLTEYALSKCTPDMVLVGCADYCKKDINNYKRNINSAMTLNERVKIATVGLVRFLRQSTLIPEELRLEVKIKTFKVPPVVMSHCLKFLCYHHLGDMFNRQQALCALHLSVKDESFDLSSLLSEAITVVGVCYEISGDEDAAKQCYEEAMQCYMFVCPTAKIRKFLLMNHYKISPRELL